MGRGREAVSPQRFDSLLSPGPSYTLISGPSHQEPSPWGWFGHQAAKALRPFLQLASGQQRKGSEAT